MKHGVGEAGRARGWGKTRREAPAIPKYLPCVTQVLPPTLWGLTVFVLQRLAELAQGHQLYQLDSALAQPGAKSRETQVSLEASVQEALGVHSLVLQTGTVSESVRMARFCCSDTIGARQATHTQAPRPLRAWWGLCSTSPPSGTGPPRLGTWDSQQRKSSAMFSVTGPHLTSGGGVVRFASCWGGGEPKAFAYHAYHNLASRGCGGAGRRACNVMHFVNIRFSAAANDTCKILMHCHRCCYSTPKSFPSFTPSKNQP